MQILYQIRRGIHPPAMQPGHYSVRRGNFSLADALHKVVIARFESEEAMVSNYSRRPQNRDIASLFRADDKCA